MENGGMFGDLTKFLKKDCFDDHKTGTLYSLDSQWDIEVYAVLKTDAADPDVYSIPQGASTLDGRFLERLKKDCQQYRDIGGELYTILADGGINEELRKLLSGHLCRCTGYQNILDAVERAVEEAHRFAGKD